MNEYLERLKSKRRSLEAKIDDYLLSNFNTAGYYYSISDTFANLDNTDVTLTSALIDTEAGEVSLPLVSTLTKKVPKESIGRPNISVVVGNASPISISNGGAGGIHGNQFVYREISPFNLAI